MSELTQRQLIKQALVQKNITAKKMCEDLGLNYMSYATGIRRKPLMGSTYVAISDYLNIDLRTLMTAPFDKPIKETKK